MVKADRSVKTVMAPNGRIVIPATIREQLDLKAGDSLFLEVDDEGVLRGETYPARIRRIQKAFAHLRRPGVLASDELIADRREEVRREEEEFRRQMEEARLRSEGKIA